MKTNINNLIQTTIRTYAMQAVALRRAIRSTQSPQAIAEYTAQLATRTAALAILYTL